MEVAVPVTVASTASAFNRLPEHRGSLKATRAFGAAAAYAAPSL
jgi:hypothetical protein